MDAAEFDRLVARARDPQLIPGIYNYCDGRCPRCPFTQRCLTFVDSQELEPAAAEQSPADPIGDSLQRTLEILAEMARRDRTGAAASAAEETEVAIEVDLDRLRQEPLAARAR